MNNTLRSILGVDQQTTAQSTRRSVLKRTVGQIMTEKDAIEQMEEKQKKKKKNFVQANQQTHPGRRKTTRKGMSMTDIHKPLCFS